MGSVTVDPAKFGAVFRVQETARMERVAGAGYEAALLGAEVVARAAPVDVGSLKSSIHARQNGTRSAELVADAPHAGILEVGSRPHWAPLQPLIDWVRRHVKSFSIKRSPKVSMRTARTAGAQRRKDALVRRGADREKEIEAVARAIQRKIARRGTRPRWFMRSQLPKLRKILAILIRRRIRDPK